MCRMQVHLRDVKPHDEISSVSLGPHRSWTHVLRDANGGTVNVRGLKVKSNTTDLNTWKVKLCDGTVLRLPFSYVWVRIIRPL